MDPVIVVGAGPVGLSTALALTRHGVPVVVLDEGPGHDEPRTARTILLRRDTAAFLRRLGCAPAPEEGCGWSAWRTVRRRQVSRRIEFGEPGPATAIPARGAAAEAEEPPESPLHVPQHILTRRLRAALSRERLARIAIHSKLDALEQDDHGVTAHTRPTGGSPGGPEAPGAGTWWRGSHLIGCDGQRSTVRKLLEIRFPGRTAVERHAVAALRAELPWPGEAVLHRSPSLGGEVTARPLPGGLWRLDWLLPPRGELVTPEALVARIRDTLGLWCDGTPPYDLLDAGVHTVHHRLAKRWRVGRAFLAGGAAHLLGALGTQDLDEGLRDAANLAWKLALVWHRHASDALLDSYQAERRAAVGSRLRAADQALPLVRGGGSWPAVRRSLVPGGARGHDVLLTDGHIGLGPLGAPPVYARSPLAPEPPEGTVRVATAPGAPVADVTVTAPDGSSARLRDRLGRDLLVLLVAPGTAVWERRHWVSAGLMPRLAAAIAALPVRAELLVTEGYPGAAAHTVLLVRPDGHLVAAMSGVRPAELYACADAARGGTAVPPQATDRSAASATPGRAVSASAPGATETTSTPGPTQRTSTPEPAQKTSTVQKTSTPGPVQKTSTPGPAQRASAPGPAGTASAHW
ncbi:FAD-dependent monooxygenase [Streptomyces sp. NPDC051776]|uniref:FAD-dependent monooxygenase n=1 Tax=Streptomyces sp. NPDC051776 TaxID=3155414 RepID=UPI00342456BB